MPPVAPTPQVAQFYEQSRWDVTVKLDGGRTQVVRMAFEPYVRQGDRVRIAGNNVELVN